MDVLPPAAAAPAERGVRCAPPLPPEAPLAMPVQSFRARRQQAPAPATSPRWIGARRAFILLFTVLLTGFAAHEMYLVLQVAGLTALETVVLVLFVVLFAWIAFSFASLLAGFVSMVARGGLPLGIDPDAPLPELSRRTALLVPVYNEDPGQVFARIAAMDESLERTGRLAHFDVFVLSDTTDPDIWIAEEAALLRLRGMTGGHERIFYRHRRYNEGRKAGNISEWVMRFGAAYDHMLIFDADSLMEGDTVVRMAAALEANPGVGLIQSLPMLMNGRTLFARLQQFAGRVYGPLMAHGIAWWHGAESNYWGHNAIIRTRAFAEQAGLPALRGRKPVGGHIMSHDFVEAALMRRGGWAVHMAPGLGGSYEEGPPAIPDYSARDRRWAQGNLQHVGVLPARGLHWVSRLHFLTGIGSYITAPLWFAFLMAGLAISLQAQFIRPEYFPAEFALFPQWPAQDPVRAAWVFAGTMSLLVIPKLLGYLALLTRRPLRQGCGGVFGAFVSVLVEIVLSALVAPMMMLTQTVTVVGAALGRDVGWQVQRRDDGSLPLLQIVRLFGWHTVVGLLLALAAYAISWPLFLWMSPVLLGLVLAIPLAWLTASVGAGRMLGRVGLLLIPEETAPSLLIRRARELGPVAPAHTVRAMKALREDTDLAAFHASTLRPPVRQKGRIDIDLALALAKLEDAEALADADELLTRREWLAVLADQRGLSRLSALQQV
ncbi:MAG TPA: glucans biosynthesis glucosyltransferase MdoH [Xanthobacteraceae bacterium]|nr:glucans biosynthesis glucosyltransferase MdoH [Xanthobacteraceae bacterium]